MARSRMHFDGGVSSEEYGAHDTLCGRPSVHAAIVTLDRDRVTCRECMRRLAAQTEEPAAEVFVAPPPYRPPPRKPWDARGKLIVDRSRAGDDGGDVEGWSSLDSALRAWWRIEARSLLGSSTDYSGSGGGDGDHTPASAKRRGRVLPVARAVADSVRNGAEFAGDAEGKGALRLSPGACREILEHYMHDRSAEDTADRISMVLRLTVTPHQVGLVWRQLRRAISAWLVARALLPAPRIVQHSAARSEGADMALAPGHELEGWQDIAKYAGLSVSTCQRAEDPIPTSTYFGRVVAKKSDVDAWKQRQVKSRQRATG